MLPIEEALVGYLALSGVIGSNVPFAVECRPSVWPFMASSLPVSSFIRAFQPPACCPLLRPLLTSLPVTRSGSPQVRTRCFSARPPHLPPRLNPRLRCVVPARRIAGGLPMRFLSISPPISSSLPPSSWLPFQTWLRVVVLLSCLHEWSSYKGLTPHLQRAHAGRTQKHGAVLGNPGLPRRSCHAL
jgi:hypothetical protein